MSQNDILDFIKKLAEDGDIKDKLVGTLDDINLDDIVKLASEHGLDIAPDQLKPIIELYQKLDDSPLGDLIDNIF